MDLYPADNAASSSPSMFFDLTLYVPSENGNTFVTLQSKVNF